MIESEYVYSTIFIINRNTVLVYVEVSSCLLCYALAYTIISFWFGKKIQLWHRYLLIMI